MKNKIDLPCNIRIKGQKYIHTKYNIFSSLCFESNDVDITIFLHYNYCFSSFFHHQLNQKQPIQNQQHTTKKIHDSIYTSYLV